MKVLWQPGEEFTRNSHLRDYQNFLKRRFDLQFPDYESLWEWSTAELATFWESVWQYFDIIHHEPYHTIVSDHSMPDTKWFIGSKLNYSEHLFRYENPDRPALIFTSEKEEVREISWYDLRTQVASLRDQLISAGVSSGDRVVGYLPNIPEVVIAFIATNSLGAIWSCCSMDFGPNTVIERFKQIEPKVFIAADGYYYKNRSFDRTKQLQIIAGALPSTKQKILVHFLDENTRLSGWQSWTEIMDSDQPSELTFRQVDFDHPMWVLYSSGTTGKPKAITQSHGGILLEHLKYMHFHNDVKPGEHFFWFTTTGWMMWNFLQASLLAGAIPVLYEGSPGHPDLDVLWRLADRLPIHHFGTSAPYLTNLMNQNRHINEHHNLSALRSIGSTGAPLPPDVFEYIYQHISRHTWLCSMSGGTDVCTAFVGGVPNKPVIKGRIQGRALGVSLHAYDEDGSAVQNKLAEMVIEKPMPSMPIYFWGDANKTRYKESYFSQYPGKWRHGDYIVIFDDGSLIIHGRSDATLNRNGVRIGTAEIYNALNEISEISDALVLNLERNHGDVMPLFLVLSDKQRLTENLQKQIKDHLRQRCSPRHVPDFILPIPDIPYTLSGKKMEVPIKKLLMGLTHPDEVNKEAIRNPAAMTYFVDQLENLKNQLDR